MVSYGLGSGLGSGLMGFGNYVPGLFQRSLPGRVYGEMVKGALQGRGITCYIRSENIGDAYQAQGTFPFGGVRIFIPENRLEESLSIQKQLMDQN